MRDTDKKQVDYEKVRNMLGKNLDDFLDNIDTKLLDENAMKTEVKEYSKQNKA